MVSKQRSVCRWQVWLGVRVEQHGHGVSWSVFGMFAGERLRGRRRRLRRQELPLNGGNGNPMSGYEANERCAADDATRPTAHRVDRTTVDRTSISALQPHADDLRSRSRTAAVHCLHASISMLTQSMFHCLLCLNHVCVLACASTACIDVASNQTACQRKKTSPDENLCSSPVKPTTTPPHSPCSSTSMPLVDHKCFFCQALRSRRSW